MVTLQLNQNQAEVLLGLLDIATKSGGLNVAEAAVFFSKNIELQLKAEQKADASQEASIKVEQEEEVKG